ncbi:MAG: hypothetical protein JWN69_1486 [Alphaproteobacteria bacterium]|nr:hypothetical protein [Alphaproteobacteria bacterium]
MRKNSLLAAVSALSIVGCWSTGAFAQEAAPQPAADTTPNYGLEDIIVTARKQAEDIQDVPLSVSAVSGATLERRGLQNVKDLAQSVPSLNLIGSNTSRASALQIRGIGSFGLNPGIEPSVGVYFDGAYQKSAAAVLSSNLLDLETIEVLRGPQGTLYGRNTPVGAVIVRSRAPSQNSEAMVQAGVGNYGTKYVQGYAGGGLSETLAARLSLNFNENTGYDYNINTDSRTNDTNQISGRARLRWTPTPAFTGDFIAFYTRVRNHCCIGDNVNPTGPFGIATPGFLAAMQTALGRPYTNLTDRDHIIDSDENPLEIVKNFGTSFSGELDLGGGHTLTSISAYTGTRMDSPRSAPHAQPLQAYTSSFINPIDTFSEELRLASSLSQRLSYQFGAYVFHEKTSFHEERTTVRPNRVFPDGTRLPGGLTAFFDFHQKTFSISGYGQATFAITDALRLTGGGRYSYDRKRGSAISSTTPGAPVNFSSQFPTNSEPNLRYSESKFTWLASLQYDIAPSIMVYGTASTGWKSGGFSGRAVAPGTPVVFGPENTRNLELGTKATFFDRRLLLNLSLYKMKVKGFQDSINNPVSGAGFIVGNAGTIHTKGVEAEMQARPIPELLLFSTVTYLDSHFSNYSAAPCFTGQVPNGSKPGTCNVNGLTPQNSPKWRFSVGAEVTKEITASGISAFARADANYTDDQFLFATLDPRSVQESYTIVNGRIGLEGADQKWRVSLWAKNLTKENYFTLVAPLANGGFFSNGGRAGVSGPLIGITGAPRTYGVEASMKF